MISVRKLMRESTLKVKTIIEHQERLSVNEGLYQDLKNDILKYSNAGNYSPSWKRMIEDFKHNILHENINNFLRWNIVKETITSKNSTLVDTEYRLLKKDENFQRLWKEHLIENPLGNPELFWKNTRYGTNKIHQVYHLMRMYNYSKINFQDLSLVLEFGGGYGNMCYLFRKLKAKAKYFIFDFPEMHCLQKYYLNSLEIKTGFELNAQNDCVLYSAIEKLETDISTIQGKKLFIATWSFSESPVELREKFTDVLKHFDYFLIAFQGAFDNVGNYSYFQNWKDHFKDIDWELTEIDHIKNNFYLLGKIK